MKRLLVTGGCGFIGSNFINHVSLMYKIINIDCLNYCASESNVVPNENYTFICGNITDKPLVDDILQKYEINIIVHFAAQSHVDSSFKDSLQYTVDNVLGTHTLLQSAKEYGKLEKFIHFSTDEVYGEVDLDHPGCTEKSLLNPTNPYAATKAAAEFIVRSYWHSFKLPVLIIRCNNVYGPNQYPEKLIPKFISLLQHNEKLTIHGSGLTRRNFIWVDDVSRAVEVIIKSGEINEIYNIGTTCEHTVLDVAAKLVDIFHNTTDLSNYITFVEDRPFNDFRYAIDSSKLQALGWKEENNDFTENLKQLCGLKHDELK